MSFSSDADILAYEPNAFVDLPYAAQRVLRVDDAAVSGATVTSEAGGFDALAGDDVIVLGVGSTTPITAIVESVADDHTLTLTAAPAGLAVPGASSGLVVESRTFAMQATLVHDELMRAIGVDPDDPSGEIGADDIVSIALMRRLEVLGTLAAAYAAAIAPGGENAAFEAKAADYRGRFVRALRGARVLIDADGDGEPDQWRTPGVTHLVRG